VIGWILWDLPAQLRRRTLKKLLIACMALVACGTTVYATGQSSISADRHCGEFQLLVVAHQGNDHVFTNLGHGMLGFSGPSPIKDAPWRWDTSPGANPDEQVIATISMEGLEIEQGTYTITMREGQHLSVSFELCNC